MRQPSIFSGITVLTLVALLFVSPADAQPQLVWSMENEELDGQGLAIFPRDNGGAVIVGRYPDGDTEDVRYYPIFHHFDAVGNLTATTWDHPPNQWHEPIGAARTDEGHIVLGCSFRDGESYGPLYLTIREYTSYAQLIRSTGFPDLLGNLDYRVEGFARRADGNYVALLREYGDYDSWLALLSLQGEVLDLQPVSDLHTSIVMDVLRDGRVVFAANLATWENPRIFWTYPWSLEVEDSVDPDWAQESGRWVDIVPMEDSRFGIVVRESNFPPAPASLYCVDPQTGVHGRFPTNLPKLRGGTSLPGGRLLLVGGHNYAVPELTRFTSTGDIDWQAQHHPHYFIGLLRWFRDITVTRENEMFAVGSSYVDWGIAYFYYVYGAKYINALPPTAPSLEVLPHFVAPELPEEGGEFPFTVWIDAVYPAEHTKTLAVTVEHPDGSIEAMLPVELTLPPYMSERVGPYELTLGADDPPGEYWIQATLDSAGVVLAGDRYRVRKALPDAVDDPAGSPSARPVGFALQPVAPNPFNASATVTVDLPAPGPLTVDVIDLQGRVVATSAEGTRRTAGRHRFTLSLPGKASGVYFVRARSGDGQVGVRKVVALK